MKVYKRNFMRPHTEAPWYTASDAFEAWIKTNYIDTGKCTQWREMTYDDSSKLTMTLSSTWDENQVDLDSLTSQNEWVLETETEVQHNEDWGIILVSKGVID